MNISSKLLSQEIIMLTEKEVQKEGGIHTKRNREEREQERAWTQ